ncbi:hypothetical protein FEM48_Zijuj09G0145800 [Ziziphus jujuba var. spinosa]|uniref:Uncharacterized protein n=1 Tax=Ziziphus jujuba var. spinosa TaxID=714518 RepID=A0A978UTJ5_ZIZJJ|nr:hypothetical protein FEM48_Zijuj09G0145800 [Ziziphus jujuba var. spinosa]
MPKNVLVFGVENFNVGSVSEVRALSGPLIGRLNFSHHLVNYASDLYPFIQRINLNIISHFSIILRLDLLRCRYMSIIKEEGLEISQPALDSDKSEVHYLLTARDNKLKVHRKIFKVIGGRKCDKNSTEPPCTGWVEMMAPVFSLASWRCTWHIIQGDRTKNIGTVDSEYVVHYGLPTLAGLAANEACHIITQRHIIQTNAGVPDRATKNVNLPNSEQLAKSHSIHESDARSQAYAIMNFSAAVLETHILCNPKLLHTVRKQSFIELEIFKNRWKKAVREDDCWSDPYQKP